MFYLISLGSALVLWAIYKLYIWPIYISPLRKIPGPPSENPFYGSFKPLMTDENTRLNWINQYGNIVKFHGIFNEPTLLIADTKIIQEITSSQSYDFIKPPHLVGGGLALVGRGLAFAEGDVHKRQRKMMNPAFIHNNIKEMIPTFTRIALILKGLIEDRVNLGESDIDLSPIISEATLDVIGAVGFSYEFNSLTSTNELAEAYNSVTNISKTSAAINHLSNYIPIIRKLPIDMNKNFQHSTGIINRVSKSLIDEKYEESKNGELKKKDLLSLLININNTLPDEEKMTDEELVPQIMTFLFAGHETTSTATGWALTLLSQHPHDQDLLREELVKAFPDKSNFNPTFDEINSLEYLNGVVKETLRCYPPLPTVSRYNIKEKVFGDYVIPKGTTINIAISALHKLPSIWGPTADKFDPKRWSDPSLIKNVSNLNYLPFYTGTRACIGNKVALNEFKILLGMLIRNFVFQPVEGFHIKNRVFPMYKPDPYVKLVVSKVEG